MSEACMALRVPGPRDLCPRPPGQDKGHLWFVAKPPLKKKKYKQLNWNKQRRISGPSSPIRTIEKEPSTETGEVVLFSRQI